MNVRSNNDARQALGGVLRYIHESYDAAGGVDGFFADGVRESIVRQLDSLRNYTENTFYGLPQDNNPMSEQNRKKVEFVQKDSLRLAREIGSSVDDEDLQFSIVNTVVEGVKNIPGVVGHAVGAVAGAAGDAAADLVGGVFKGLGIYLVAALVIIGVVVFFYVRRGK